MDDGYPISEEESIEEHNQYLDEIDKYCNNCGRKHEGRLVETFLDGDNEPIEIVVCNGPVYPLGVEYDKARAQRIVDNPGWESEE